MSLDDHHTPPYFGLTLLEPLLESLHTSLPSRLGPTTCSDSPCSVTCSLLPQAPRDIQLLARAPHNSGPGRHSPALEKQEHAFQVGPTNKQADSTQDK